MKISEAELRKIIQEVLLDIQLEQEDQEPEQDSKITPIQFITTLRRMKAEDLKGIQPEELAEIVKLLNDILVYAKNPGNLAGAAGAKLRQAGNLVDKANDQANEI